MPSASFLEKDGTYTNLERRIQRIRAVCAPPRGSRPDCWILSELLRRTGQMADYDSPSDVMTEIAQAVPQMRGVSYAILDRRPVFWPCPDETSGGNRISFRGGAPIRTTPPHPRAIMEVEPPQGDLPLVAVRGKSLACWGSGTRSGRSFRVKGLRPNTESGFIPQ